MNKLNNICTTIFDNFKKGNAIAPAYDYDIPPAEYIVWSKDLKKEAHQSGSSSLVAQGV